MWFRSIQSRPSQRTRLHADLEPLEQRHLLSGCPALSIGDVSLAEGQAGTTTAYVFTVSLSARSSKQVTVKYATSDGSALAGGDYAQASGALKFAPGETAKTITVLVNGDTGYEPNETFFVNLGAARNATVADAQGVGTILNDDAAPSAVYPPSSWSDNRDDFYYEPIDSSATLTDDGAAADESQTSYTEPGSDMPEP